MSVAQDIQRAMNTTAKQVMADAPYDKSRTGMVVDYDEATNTYSVIVDRVTYEKIPIVNGLKANVNDIVKVVYPTNNISQMYINSICPLDKIKFYLPIDATEIITPNIILYDDGTNSRALTGYPSGELNWGGTPVSLQGHTHTNPIKNLTQRIVSFKGTAANTWQYNGVSFTIPSGHLYLVRPTLSWSTGKPIGVGFDSASSVGASGFPAYNFENANGFYVPPVFMLYTGTYYMFEKRASTPTTANTTYVNFVDINFGAVT